ncbi:hypothetical protein [Deinococcus murrayi]|uniref:hypothetical protein n=1 Tax=Deinococcus murrayi TaxID=68910 RepID=UPI00146FAB8B|nr:hypothetical protein [Deinococcus murrayi]
MKANQRVVKSVPDRSGNAYTKTSAGGKARMQAAANYMDERENTQLYKLENGELRETDRHEAAASIEDTSTQYQQHLAFTTKLDSAVTHVNEREAAEHVARSIQERRPDAEIYAIAVHSDGKGDEKGIHVHVIVGTRTTLRRDDLRHFREEAYKLERTLERDLSRGQKWRESRETRVQPHGWA